MFTRLITLLPIVVRLAAVTAAMPNGLKARDGVCSTFDSREYCCTPALYVRDFFTSLPRGEFSDSIFRRDPPYSLENLDPTFTMVTLLAALSFKLSTMSFYYAQFRVGLRAASAPRPSPL